MNASHSQNGHRDFLRRAWPITLICSFESRQPARDKNL